MVDVSEIRKYWQVPAIGYFCSLFKGAFGVTDFDIEELEEALVAAAMPEGSVLVDNLVSQLLKGCYGRNVPVENQRKYISDLLQYHWVEVEGRTNPLESASFQELPVGLKIEVLYQLCNCRCDSYDVTDLLKGYEGDDLRVLPLGQNAKGALFWYFYGVQLYREDPEPEPAPEQKKKRPQKKKHFIFKAKKKKGRKKGAKKKGKEEEQNEDSPKKPAEPVAPPAPQRWHLVCHTLEDWEKLSASLKDSKNRHEKALYKVINQSFLPEIPKIIEEKEKERRRRLIEMEPRRLSSRLEIKKQQQEEQMKLMQEEEDKYRSVEDEQRRRRLEEQRKEEQRLEREAREHARHEREMAREDRARRAQLREERAALIAEGKEIPPELFYDGNSRSSEKLSEETLSRMFKVLDAVKGHKDAWPFLDPVTEDIAPGYHEVIKRPMDLNTISFKLDGEEYNSENQFLSDFKLIFQNCRRFNGIHSDIGRIGMSLKKFFDKCVKRFMPSEEDEDSSEEEYHTFARISSTGTSSRPRRQASTKALQTLQQTEDSDDDWYEPPPVVKRVRNPPSLDGPFRSPGGTRSHMLQAMISNREKELRSQVDAVRKARQRLPATLSYTYLNKGGVPAKIAMDLNGSRSTTVMSSQGLSCGGSVQLTSDRPQPRVVQVNLSAEDFRRLAQNGKLSVVPTQHGEVLTLKSGVQLTEKVLEPPPLLPGPTEILSNEESSEQPPTLTVQSATTTASVTAGLSSTTSSPLSMMSPIPGLSRIVYPNLARSRVNGAQGQSSREGVPNRPVKKRKIYDPPDDEDDELYVPPTPRMYQRKVYNPSPIEAKDLPPRLSASSPRASGCYQSMTSLGESKRTWGGSRRGRSTVDWTKSEDSDGTRVKRSPPQEQQTFSCFSVCQKDEPHSSTSPVRAESSRHFQSVSEARDCPGSSPGAETSASPEGESDDHSEGEEEPMEEDQTEGEESPEEEASPIPSDEESVSSASSGNSAQELVLDRVPNLDQHQCDDSSAEDADESEDEASLDLHDHGDHPTVRGPVASSAPRFRLSEDNESLPSLDGQSGDDAPGFRGQLELPPLPQGSSAGSSGASSPASRCVMADLAATNTAGLEPQRQSSDVREGVAVNHCENSGNPRPSSQARHVEPILERLQFF